MTARQFMDQSFHRPGDVPARTPAQLLESALVACKDRGYRAFAATSPALAAAHLRILIDEAREALALAEGK